MKRISVLLCLLLFGSSFLKAQLLVTTPEFPTANSSVTVTVDATKGNKGLLGFSEQVFLHTGVITSLSVSPTDWKYVQGTWATANAPEATSAGTNSNKWTFTIPNVRQFYGVPEGEEILRITILFRNQAGTLVQRNMDNSDMYIQVYEEGVFSAKFVEPLMQPTYIPYPEPIASDVTSVNVKVVTSQPASTIVKFNDEQIAQSADATEVSGTAAITGPCEQLLSYEAVAATTLNDTVSFFVNPPDTDIPLGPRPEGLKDGITFESNNTEAVFILYAPGKKRVQLVGDFNNWRQTCSGLMFRDGDYYWTRVSDLTPGQSYRFQYIVEDSIRIADPYSPLVLDPNNDRWIPKVAYPNMPEYPVGKTPDGYVGIITPGEAPFNWTSTGTYKRPNKYDLMIYELHMRDFLRNESYQSLIDTLPYLVNLGFNAIQLMPITEFDGNNSWGYNPCYYFAPDKAYGSKEKLKEFIDKAHSNGIAVILDVAFNQATGQAPMARMWWNSVANKPAANNPYFYTDARHPFNVYNDFNHNSPATKTHVERFIDFWLKEYRIDGFRWDLSKGFTPADYNCPSDDVGCWGRFSQGRIDILQNYYNKMQEASQGSYCILEHFAEDAEEYELGARGMLLWGKMTAEFSENTMGTGGNKDISRAYWWNRRQDNFVSDKPWLISYAESHDEERIMYKNLTFGSYKNLNTDLPRTEAMAAILMGIPGPKMIWQFGELGYETSIAACPPNPFEPNGIWITPTGADYNPAGGCRTDRKPIRWNYFTSPSGVNPLRRKIYNVYASMTKLRKKYPNAFNRLTVTNGTVFGNELWKSVAIDHPDLKMVIVANFQGGDANNANQSFPENGTWYDYMNGGTINVSGNNATIAVPAHSYRIYINKQETPVIVNPSIITDAPELSIRDNGYSMVVYPNPVSSISTVKYNLPKSGKVHLQLINLQGQVLISRNMGFQAAGLQFTSLNMSGVETSRLSSGTYFLQMRVDNEVMTQKIVVQR